MMLPNEMNNRVLHHPVERADLNEGSGRMRRQVVCKDQIQRRFELRGGTLEKAAGFRSIT